VVTPTGDHWRFDVDDAGRTLSGLTPGGQRVDFDWTAAGRIAKVAATGRREEKAEWGTHGALASLVDGSGATTRLEYDRLGEITGVQIPSGGRWEFGYDGVSLLTTIVDPDQGSWSQRWSPTGAFAGFTDPLGHDHRIEVDALGRPTAAISPLGRKSEITWKAGLPQAAKDPDGGTVELRRDVAGQPIEAWRDGRLLARYGYTAAGRPATVSLVDGTEWRYRYDRAGRVVSVDGPQGASEFVWDAAGRPLAYLPADGERIDLVYGPDGRVAERRLGEAVTRLLWTPDGRIRQVTRPDGSVQACRYDERGYLVEVVDPNGAATTVERDALGNPAAVVAADGARWLYEHDPMGRTTAITDPLGRQTRLKLDRAGRLSTFAPPDLPEQQWTWDPDGMLQSIAADGRSSVLIERDLDGGHIRAVDVDGVASDLEWDTQGRVLARTIDHRTTRFRYDDDARTMTVEPAGGGGGSTYQWDGRGRVATIDHPSVGSVRLVRDRQGRVRRLEAAGLRREWIYNTHGGVVSYQEEIGGRVSTTSLERDALGRVTAEHRDGVTSRFRYDKAGQLVGFDGTDGTWSWTYDANGRLTKEAGPSGERSFVYDPAGQLVRWDADSGETITFAFDGLGRRIAETGVDHRVTYFWDDLGRLRSVERNGVVTTLEVGAFGELAGVDSTPLEWSPDESPVAMGDRAVVGLPGLPVATLSATGEVDWLSADWRGSVGDGTTPWGPASDVGGPRIGYLGEIETAGLIWLRNRIYDPATHAFLSRDPLAGPIAQPGGLTNPYQYANNDPINHVDPTGLKPLTADQAQQQMQDWHQAHWGEIAAPLLAAGAVVMIATGVGAPIGAGILIGMAASGGIQMLTTGRIDMNQLAISGIVGGVGGGVGSLVAGMPAVAGLASAIGDTSPLAASAVTNGVTGAAQGFAMSATGQLLTNGRIDPAQLALGTATGGATGAVAGPAIDALASRVSGGVVNAASNANPLNESAPPPNYIYSARELIRRGNEPGPMHNFPDSFDKVITGEGSRTVVPSYFNKPRPLLSNDSVQYRLPGAVNGRAGNYELFTRPSVSGRTEVIMHRFFRPTK
jgi:RHS repeat-associated protein